MFEILFGNENTEKILFYLLRNKSCYGKKLSDQFETGLSHLQRTLSKLERSGIIISTTIGKTRVYEFNPRYLFLNEFKVFLEKAYETLPQEIKEKYYETKERKRPRRAGKPL